MLKNPIFKKNKCFVQGLERWLSVEEYMLPLKETGCSSQNPHGDPKLYVITALGDLIPSYNL